MALHVARLTGLDACPMIAGEAPSVGVSWVEPEAQGTDRADRRPARDAHRRPGGAPRPPSGSVAGVPIASAGLRIVTAVGAPPAYINATTAAAGLLDPAGGSGSPCLRQPRAELGQPQRGVCRSVHQRHPYLPSAWPTPTPRTNAHPATPQGDATGTND
ncbi:hypothetical protein LL972_15280 [Xanthomonas campestris pv. asclepiadis]|uniref:hypothetical protein n=1 Tax=Xanthomonas campestris TaxID=339 RepID=UPI001E606362|nr:hypothetical protein [Xanthomonas campestris]MCC4617345.1 hypothetical protein [Xanthomonas campestris pv. asclepiadis]